MPFPFFSFIWQAELRAAVFLALEEQEKVEVREFKEVFSVQPS